MIGRSIRYLSGDRLIYLFFGNMTHYAEMPFIAPFQDPIFSSVFSRPMSRALVFFLLIFLLGTSGCGSGSETVRDRGTSHVYQTGYPEVLARVTSFFDVEDNPVVVLNLELPHNNLVFRTIDGQRKAAVELSVQYRKLGVTAEGDVTGTLRENIDIIPSEGPERFRTLIERVRPVNPGTYQLEVRVRDRSSNKASQVVLQVKVPDPERPEPTLSDIRVALLGEGETRNITSYLIPASHDSLRFELFVARSDDSLPVELRMRLIEFRSDTAPARAMGHLPVSSGSIQFRGIDFSDQTELASQRRTLDTETGPILIEYSFPRPEAGNYRLEITLETTGPDGQTEETVRFRDFAMVSPGFPDVRTVREMAEPLVYLMRERDFRNMMRMSDPDSIRREIDRFWLRDMNPRQAREQIERFYTRVEEANRLFSTFKEGWKTDMGLVYILLGPPVYVESSIDAMIWHYSHNRMDPRTVIIFERARVTSNSWPFQHYILSRNRFYQSIELEAIGNWTSGRMPMLN